jgi:hypothetical protein
VSRVRQSRRGVLYELEGNPRLIPWFQESFDVSFPT